MFDLDRYEEIWNTLTRNKARSLITASGVFGSIVLLIMMLSVSRGMENVFNGFANSTEKVAMAYTQPTSLPYKGNSKGRSWNPTYSELNSLVRRVPGLKGIAKSVSKYEQYDLTYKDKVSKVNIHGREPFEMEVSPFKLTHGRFINDIDISRSRRVCILTLQAYEELFEDGENPLGEVCRLGPTFYTIVGVVEPTQVSFNYNDGMFIIPLTTMIKQYNLSDRIGSFTIMADANADIDDVMNRTKKELYKQNNISPDDKKALYQFSLSDIAELYDGLLSGINILTWVVGLGSLLAGIIGVSNIMLITVKERTQEIGVRRAIGATPQSIIMQIMEESFFLTFITGVLALGFSVFSLSMVYNFTKDTFDPRVSISIAVISTIIVIISSILAGIIPALRAINIKAVDAIREE